MRPLPRRPSALIPLLVLLALPACDVDRQESRTVSFSRTEDAAEEDDVFAILSREGEVKLGLTEEQVYFRLSDETLAEIEQDMEEDVSEEDGLGAIISDAVTAGVSRALRFRVAWDIDEIREIRYEDGELVMEMVDGEIADIDVTVEDEDVTEAFAEDDVRRFIAEFERVKNR